MPRHKNHLSITYQTETAEDVQALYTDWAATYDAEILENGYATPWRCADALAKCTPDKNLRILDIGCGTGLSGKILIEEGFTQIDGCDINKEMLNIAKNRDIYNTLWLSDTADPSPFTSDTYDAITAGGVLGVGAAPPELLAKAIKKLGNGGLIVFSLNDHSLQDPDFINAANNPVDEGMCELLFKEYGEHLPGQNLKSNVYVMRKM